MLVSTLATHLVGAVLFFKLIESREGAQGPQSEIQRSMFTLYKCTYNPCPSLWLINLHRNLVWISFHFFCAVCTRVFDGIDSIAHVPDTNYVALSDLRKVSTGSEKQSLKRRGEEVVALLRWAEGANHFRFPKETTSSTSPSTPPPFPRVCAAPCSGEGGIRRRRRTDFRWRRHGSQSSSRCRPTRPPSANSCRLPASFPLLAFFLASFLVLLLNRPALFGFRPGRTAGRSRTGICSSTRTASASSRRVREAR